MKKCENSIGSLNLQEDRVCFPEYFEKLHLENLKGDFEPGKRVFEEKGF